MQQLLDCIPFCWPPRTPRVKVRKGKGNHVGNNDHLQPVSSLDCHGHVGYISSLSLEQPRVLGNGHWNQKDLGFSPALLGVYLSHIFSIMPLI